ncbi:hypothetical protein DP117_35410 [Brasilonema sp. UFV-L1]|nr:hypothetical protein [Brasilonema sp. UFV-L1]
MTILSIPLFILQNMTTRHISCFQDASVLILISCIILNKIQKTRFINQKLKFLGVGILKKPGFSLQARSEYCEQILKLYFIKLA